MEHPRSSRKIAALMQQSQSDSLQSFRPRHTIRNELGNVIGWRCFRSSFQGVFQTSA